MSTIEVLSRTQKIVVDSNKSVSIVNAGPIGPRGYSSLGLLEDVDLTGAEVGDVFTLLGNGKWGPSNIASQVELDAVTLALGGEVDRATASEADILAQLGAEIDRAMTAEADVLAQLGAETDRAVGAETDILAQLGGVSADLGALGAAFAGHTGASQNVHGISNAANLAYQVDIASLFDALALHSNDSTNVHGITDAANLVYTDDARLNNMRVPTDGSVTNAKVAANAQIAYSKLNLLGSILPGDLGFDLATQPELDAHINNVQHPYLNVAKTWTATQSFSSTIMVGNASFNSSVSTLTIKSNNYLATYQMSESINVGHSFQWRYPSEVGMVLKGAASQTADMFEIQDSSGAIKVKVDPSANYDLTVNNYVRAGNLFTYNVMYGSDVKHYTDTGPYLSFTGSNALLRNRDSISNVIFTVRGMASQTGDLFQAQNSAGAILARIGSDGYGYFPSGITAGPSPAAGGYSRFGTTSSAVPAITANANASGYRVIQASANDTVNLAIYSDGMMSSGGMAGLFAPAATIHTKPTAVSNIGMIVQGLASQSADVFQMRDSSNADLVTIGATGRLRVGSQAAHSSIPAAVKMIVTDSSDAYFGAAIGGKIAWIESFSNQGYVDAYDYVAGIGIPLNVGNNASLLRFKIAGITRATVDSGGMVVWSGSATSNPLVLSGFASQSADLFVLQNSAAAVLARFDSAGKLGIGTSPWTPLHVGYSDSAAYSPTGDIATAPHHAARFENLSTTADYSAIDLVTRPTGPSMWRIVNQYMGSANNGDLAFQTRTGAAGNTSSEVLRLKNNGQVLINGFTASTVGLIVKGASSQASEFFQAQDSAGVAQMHVRNDGWVSTQGIWGGGTGGRTLTPYFTFSSTMLELSTTSTGLIGLRIQGAASQNNNPLEYLKGNANTVFRMDGDGNLYVQNNGNPQLSISRTTADEGRIAIAPGNGSWSDQAVGGDMVIRNSVNNRGIILAARAVNSNIRMTTGAADLLRFSIWDADSAQFYNTAAAKVALFVRGAASQSADLFQAQDSASAVLTRITSGGNLVFGATNDQWKTIQAWGTGIRIGNAISIGDRQITGMGGGTLLIGGSATGGATDGVAIDGNTSSYVSSVLTGSFSMFRVGQPVNPNAATTNLSPTAVMINPSFNYASGGSGVYTALKIAVTETAVPTGPNYLIDVYAGSGGTTKRFSIDNRGTTSILLGNSTSIGQIVKGDASQSADLQQYQDSAGVIKNRIDPSGYMYVQNDSNPRIYLSRTNNNEVVLAVSGSVGNFSNQSSNGDLVIASYVSGRSILLSSQSPTGAIKMSTGSAPEYLRLSVGATWGFELYNTTVSAVGLMIRGAASQSADLFQAQDSAATIKAKIASDGTLFIGNASFNSSISTLTIKSNNNVALYQMSESIGVGHRFQWRYPDEVGMILKAAASQTAHLQQWQNSVGTVLAGVDESGRGFFGTTGVGSGALYVRPIATTLVGLAVRGLASQTGNLLEAQDSAGAVLHAITSAGLPKWAAASSVQTTIGAAGPAAALPASPTKYLKAVADDGVTYGIPAFALS